MKKLTKTDAEYISIRFYDFHDKVWEILKEMAEIRNEVEGFDSQEISLDYYCIARHDKNIIVANFYASGQNQEVQFPLHYLYDDNWKSNFKEELIQEKEKINQSREGYKKNRDLEEIKRLKRLYPDAFKQSIKS